MLVPTMTSSRPAESTPLDRSPQSIRPNSSPGISRLEDPFSSAPSWNLQTAGTAEKSFRRNDASAVDQRPRLSPTKSTSNLGQLSFNEDKHQRISMSPRAIGSRKETLGPKSPFAQEQRPLKVYEDPVQETPTGVSYPPPLSHSPRALEELPVNEPVKNRQAYDHQLLAEEPQSPEYHQKWLAIEAAEHRRLSSLENTENPRMARKILDSGIDRLKAGTLDAHGFRKLQALIRKSGEAIWEDGYKFDELMMPLLEYLEAPCEDAAPRSGKAQDNKTQDLVTIRLLLKHQPSYFSGYYPRALIAVITARKYYSSTSHIVCGLEETAESIAQQCDPGPCVDSILDLLEEQGVSGADETTTICMALYILAGLLHSVQEKGANVQLEENQEARLGDVGAKYIVNTNPDIRRAVIEFVLELHDTVNQDRFWTLVTGGRDDHKSLITYYLARKRAAAG